MYSWKRETIPFGYGLVINVKTCAAQLRLSDKVKTFPVQLNYKSLLGQLNCHFSWNVTCCSVELSFPVQLNCHFSCIVIFCSVELSLPAQLNCHFSWIVLFCSVELSLPLQLNSHLVYYAVYYAVSIQRKGVYNLNKNHVCIYLYMCQFETVVSVWVYCIFEHVQLMNEFGDKGKILTACVASRLAPVSSD